MSITHPEGLSRGINRMVVLATLLFSVCALGVFITLHASNFHHANSQSVVFGMCLFVCSLFSYLYTMRFIHIPLALMRQLDHAAIFLLIAGTYTPFALPDILGPLGIPLLYWIWALAVAGIILRMLFRTGHDRLFVGLYVLLGWLFLTAIPDIIHRLPQGSLMLLASGAVAYSVGALIFARDIGRWTDPVWHICVLGAGGLHFMAVLALAGRVAG